MEITNLSPGGFACACYLVREGTDAVLIDCSASPATVEEALSRQGAHLAAILCTHGHFDHIISIDTIRERYDVPIYIHKNDACMLTDGKLNGFYIFFERDCIHKPAERFFADGDSISIENEYLNIIHTPGHSQGSCCFSFFDDNGNPMMITGDTLFANSVGRCDLYGGNVEELVSSIKRLSAFDKDTCIYPGHDVSSTLGEALENVSYIFDF